MPSGVKATTDGRSGRPSASGMTRGKRVAASTYATRLFVVPRSMPMICDMGILPECVGQIIDDGLEIGARGERLLERGQHGGAVGRRCIVPPRAQRPRQTRLLLSPPRAQPRALLGERRAHGLVERPRRRSRLGKRLL